MVVLGTTRSEQLHILKPHIELPSLVGQRSMRMAPGPSSLLRTTSSTKQNTLNRKRDVTWAKGIFYCSRGSTGVCATSYEAREGTGTASWSRGYCSKVNRVVSGRDVCCKLRGLGEPKLVAVTE